MYRKRDNILMTEFLLLTIVIVVGIISFCTVCGKMENVKNYIQKSDAEIIDTALFTDKDTKNSRDLVVWAQNACENRWGYVYGTWGNMLTESLLTEKAKQYAADVGENKAFIRRNYMNRRVTDCVGLIKGYCWFSETAGIVYASNNFPDIGANRLFEEAAEKGNIETLPEIPGIAVWAKGHIGVYIGDGWVIEAKSTFDGVVKTKVDERPWTHWCKIPFIDYEQGD